MTKRSIADLRWIGRRKFTDVFDRDVDGTINRIRSLSRERLVQHHAQRINVGSWAELLRCGRCLLGAGPGNGANDVAGHCEMARLQLLFLSKQVRQTKV